MSLLAIIHQTFPQAGNQNLTFYNERENLGCQSLQLSPQGAHPLSPFRLHHQLPHHHSFSHRQRTSQVRFLLHRLLPIPLLQLLCLRILSLLLLSQGSEPRARIMYFQPRHLWLPNLPQSQQKLQVFSIAARPLLAPTSLSPLFLVV